MAGQSLHDRFTAARHTLYGQNLARAVCKATTEEIIGPKKKHLDYLIHCTNEPNVSVPELCNLLIERTQQSSWVIVFKSLITTHHLMCYGNERFLQCMATSSCKFHLGTFVDKTNAQGHDMSTFVRRYAKYLNAKAASYRTMGADFCRIKRGKDEGVLRNMSTEALLKALPVLQEQLDALIEFDCNPDDLSNGVMNSCFVLLYRDLIQLFAAYNDGIINLFEKYFNMNKKHCREALDVYKKFVVAMDKVSDFLKVAEIVGIDKGNIPDLTKAPNSLLEEMESHLTFLEGKKGHSASIASREHHVQNAVSALNSTSTAFTSSITSVHELNGLTIDESMRRAVEEEAAVMNQLKHGDQAGSLSPDWDVMEQRLKELASRRNVTSESSGAKIPSPLPPPSVTATSMSPSSTKIKETSATSVTKPSTASSAADDLLMINPPVSNFGSAGQPQFSQVPLTNFPLEGNTASSCPGFVSEDAFKTAFNTTSVPDSSTADVFGQVLQPQSTVSPTSSPVPEQSESKSSPEAGKLVTSDLDTSLQTLVQNLDMNGGKKPIKTTTHQWGSPKPVARTGGVNWSPSAAPMTNYNAPQVPVQPVVQAMPVGIAQMPIACTVVPPYVYPAAAPPQPHVTPTVWTSPPAGYGVNQLGMATPQMQMVAPTAQPMVINPARQTAPNPANVAGWPATNDPFGAL